MVDMSIVFICVHGVYKPTNITGVAQPFLGFQPSRVEHLEAPSAAITRYVRPKPANQSYAMEQGHRFLNIQHYHSII